MIVGMDAGVSAASSYVNLGRLLVYKLGGEAVTAAVATKRTVIPEPPDLQASSEVVTRGEDLYHQLCAVCHGLLAVSSGAISDLRMMSSTVHENFGLVVKDGTLADLGMASVADVLDDEGVEAIHAYVASRAAQDRAVQ